MSLFWAFEPPASGVFAESMIEELGYTTFSAANAREALAVLESGAAITRS
jgi:CheY-like chemotaxis protein